MARASLSNPSGWVKEWAATGAVDRRSASRERSKTASCGFSDSTETAAKRRRSCPGSGRSAISSHRAASWMFSIIAHPPVLPAFGTGVVLRAWRRLELGQAERVVRPGADHLAAHQVARIGVEDVVGGLAAMRVLVTDGAVQPPVNLLGQQLAMAGVEVTDHQKRKVAE